LTQNGVVTRILDNNKAEVSILRGTACGGSCGSCESCVYNSKILVEADNPIYAQPGDRVTVSSKTSRVIGATFLIYMLPLFVFFLAYALAYKYGLAQGGCVAVSFVGLLVGALCSVILGRKSKEMSYELSSFIR